VSVPVSVSGKHLRPNSNGFCRFLLDYARGSLLEIETQLIVAQRLGYLDAKEIEKLMELTNEIGRVASGLIRALSRTT
jgi:four helix bundle protein